MRPASSSRSHPLVPFSTIQLRKVLAPATIQRENGEKKKKKNLLAPKLYRMGSRKKIIKKKKKTCFLTPLENLAKIVGNEPRSSIKRDPIQRIAPISNAFQYSLALYLLVLTRSHRSRILC